MVYWTCCFKIATRKASEFVRALKRVIAENCNFEWRIETDVGKRITKVTAIKPVFGYRVSLNVPWETIRAAERQFYKVVGKTKMAFLDVAAKYGAKVEVFNSSRTVYVEPQKIVEAEIVEKEAVKIIARALSKIKGNVENHKELLSIDSIVEQAKRQI